MMPNTKVSVIDQPTQNSEIITAIDELADQLCLAMNGNFDISVRTLSDNESLQKLGVLINFVLSEARKSIDQVSETRDQLQHLSEVLEVSMHTLQTSEAISREIVDNVADAIIMIDEEGLVCTCNQAGTIILGRDVADIQWKPVNDFISYEEETETRKSNPHAYMQWIRKICGIKQETEANKSDGTIFPVELFVSEVEVDEKKAFVMLIKDLTEVKSNEDKLKQATDQLIKVSRQAGMAEIATGVLHNVGNVLNSLNVSLTLVSEKATRLDIESLQKATDMLDENSNDLASYIGSDKKGKMIPGFLSALAKHSLESKDSIMKELEVSKKCIKHIKEIVNQQQAYAGTSGVSGYVELDSLMEEAEIIVFGGQDPIGITVQRNYAKNISMNLDKEKLLQILVNLLSNSKDSLLESRTESRMLYLSVGVTEKNTNRIEVKDNGVGIANENLTKIFNFGYTTKPKGHGFGLHSSVLAAKELGGCLLVDSDGLGKGAVFALEFQVIGSEG